MKRWLKLIYRLIPLKKQLFSLVRIFPVPETIFRHLHFRGPFTVKLGRERFTMIHNGSEIENRLFWQRGWESGTLDVWADLCRDAGVILDIGANSGLFSLVAETVNPNAQVYAFEPLNRIYRKLEANRKINNFHFTTLEKAASDRSRVREINDFAGENEVAASFSTAHFSAEQKGNVVKHAVTTITLEEFIDSYQLKGIDLMKIDVETHEPEVLAGMGGYLRKFRPNMIIEVLTHEVAEKVEQLVDGLDYCLYFLDESGKVEKVEHLTHRHHLNTNYLLSRTSLPNG